MAAMAAAPDAPGASPAVSAAVAELGAEIRTLKEKLRAQGLSSSEVNRNDAVLAKVAELSALKGKLDAGDPATDAAFFARQRADMDEKRRRERSMQESQKAEMQNAEAAAAWPRVQRKIFHLFRYAGNGDAFHYEPPPRLNDAQTSFGAGECPHPPVYITEKWDGTTMQATSRGIFQRLDVWGSRKQGKDPAGRYSLRLIAWREDSSTVWRGLDFIGADVRYEEALRAHLPAIAALPEDVCVYFELVHTNVNTTFKGLPGFAGIRVFDMARHVGSRIDTGAASDDKAWEFLPFEETIELAGRFNLPIVGWKRCERLVVQEVWADLQAAASQHYTTAAAPLEGFVIREAAEGSRPLPDGGRIAKARVEVLRLGRSSGSESGRTVRVSKPVSAACQKTSHRRLDDPLCSSAAGVTLNYLAEIGLSIYS
eukprot:TRINITY_DN16436_c0_g2_i1.p1 TRINITY_DN16436_c0_g2~~TRINITY_DN16436_c0_g2_i1.p1  ORF type:complete len:426 (-),score=83.47 TRINITY_DN16436_c0_g2_i1:167-1444(-)